MRGASPKGVRPADSRVLVVHDAAPKGVIDILAIINQSPPLAPHCESYDSPILVHPEGVPFFKIADAILKNRRSLP